MGIGMPFEQFLIMMTTIIGSVVVLRGPIGRAFAARIEGRRALEPAEVRELFDLRARVAALEEGQSQLAEVQERLDFAERLLAQQTRSTELPGS
jgi:Tfp pilus assembly protein PilO